MVLGNKSEFLESSSLQCFSCVHAVRTSSHIHFFPSNCTLTATVVAATKSGNGFLMQDLVAVFKFS